MSDVKTRPAEKAVRHDADYYAWTREQALRLRKLRPAGLDWEHIAEEMDDLGGSQRREIRSRLLVALIHLLKWAHQPAKRSNSWRASIAGARKEISRELQESPSLRRYPAQELEAQYEIARLDASGQTGLPLEAFPEACPFTTEQVLDPDFWPDAARPA